MKKLIVTLVLASVFVFSGMGDVLLNSMGYLVSGTNNAVAAQNAGKPTGDWVEQLNSVFNPEWQEKLHNADLVTMLQAATGTKTR